MRRYQKILVTCTLTPNDPPVLAYAGRLTELAESAHIEFCHYTPALAQTDALAASSLQAELSGELEAEVKKHYTGRAQTQTQVTVTAGHPIYAILDRARKEEYDLIVCGHDAHSRELARRLARKAPCSVCLVPPGNWTNFKKVLVPIDFSKHSTDALDVAAAFATAQGLSHVLAAHALSLPAGAHRATIGEEGVREIQWKTYQDKLDEFIAAQPSKAISYRSILLEGSEPVYAIFKAIEQHEIDLLVIGCRGKDALSALLLGSTAERLLEGAKVPVIAVKQKGTGRTFLQQLLGN